MQIGKLRHRLAVQAKSAARGTSGGETETWPTTATYWCAFRQLTGRALETAQMTHPDVTHDISMHYTTGITAKNRGLYDGRVFDFLTVVDVDELHVETRILAREGVSQG